MLNARVLRQFMQYLRGAGRPLGDGETPPAIEQFPRLVKRRLFRTGQGPTPTAAWRRRAVRQEDRPPLI